MVEIKKAKRDGRTVYKAHQLPSTVLNSIIEWNMQGWDEQYTVVLDRFTKGIMVYESIWNEDEQDWDTVEVQPADVDLTVYLP